MRTISMKPQTFTWLQAASILGISRTALLRELKDRGVLTEDRQFGTAPTEAYAQKGLFKTELTITYINGTIPKHYRKTRVTVQGLAWLEKTLSSKTEQAA